MISLLFSLVTADKADLDTIAKLVKDNRPYRAYSMAASQISQIGIMDADPLLFYYRGITGFELAKYVEAIDDLTRYIRVGKDSNFLRSAKTIRGRAYLRIGYLDDALRDATTSENYTLIKRCKTASQLFDKANKLETEGKFKQALESYKELINISASSIKILIKAASCALELGDIDTYTEYTTQAMQVSPDDADLLFFRGKYFMCDDDLEMAARHFKKCAQINTGNTNKCPMYLRNTNDFRKNQQKFENATNHEDVVEAQVYADKLIKMANKFCKPNTKLSVSAHVSIVDIIQLNSTDQDALDYINDLIKKSPNSSKLYNARGHLHLKLGDPDEANNDFQEARTIDPFNKEAEEMIDKIAKAKEEEKNVDFYELLEVPRDASKTELKDAYRRAVRKWHPDRFIEPQQKKEAERKMKNINRAWDILSDPQKKQLYDQGIDPENPNSGGGFDQGNFQGFQGFQGFQFGGFGFPGGFNIRFG